MQPSFIPSWHSGSQNTIRVYHFLPIHRCTAQQRSAFVHFQGSLQVLPLESDYIYRHDAHIPRSLSRLDDVDVLCTDPFSSFLVLDFSDNLSFPCSSVSFLSSTCGLSTNSNLSGGQHGMFSRTKILTVGPYRWNRGSGTFKRVMVVSSVSVLSNSVHSCPAVYLLVVPPIDICICTWIHSHQIHRRLR